MSYVQFGSDRQTRALRSRSRRGVSDSHLQSATPTDHQCNIADNVALPAML